MAVREATDEEVAHHEAGHVVSAMVLGIPFTSVSIKRTRNSGDGRMRLKRGYPDGIGEKFRDFLRQREQGQQKNGITDPVLRRYYFDLIVNLFAGPYAEKHFYPDALWAHGGAYDMETINIHLGWLAEGHAEREEIAAVCAAAARELVAETADRIRLVAAALLVHQKLTAKQIKKLMTLEMPA